MKTIKNLILIVGIIFLSGCSLLKKDTYDGIDIYTTAYATEYITDRLYGEYSNIYSIYPDGDNIDDYTFTNKKINEFSKSKLFIYNGLSNEKQIAASLVNKNKKLNIIDVSQGLELKNHNFELWISPSNCLMIAQNIKNGLKEVITNKTILETIDTNYENLKIEISELDAELKLIAENSDKSLIVSSDAFNFLSKYGFDIINISSDDESTSAMSKAKLAFSSKENTYLFVLNNVDETDKDISSLVNSGATLKKINPINNITDEERKNGDNYITFMKEFIDAIKSEVY